MSRTLMLRSGGVAAFTAVVLLGWQVLLGVLMGDEITLLGTSLDPARMTSFFTIDAPNLTWLMAVDDGFAIAYGIVFLVLAWCLLPEARYLAIPALVFALLAMCADLAENSLMLAAVGQVSQGQPLEPSTLTTLFWLGQIKFLLAYPAAILFALGLWEKGRAGRVLAILLVAFPIIGIASIAVEALVLLKILWMGVLLAAGGVFFLRSPGRAEENNS